MGPKALKSKVGRLSASSRKTNRNTLNGSSVVYANIQNNRHWSIEDADGVHEVPRHNLRESESRSMSEINATRIMGRLFIKRILDDM